MDVRAAVLAGGLFSAGFPTDIAGGFHVGGDLFFGELLQERWSVGLEVRALMPALAKELDDGTRLEISSITAAIVPCVHWKVLAGCVFFEPGAMIKGGVGHPPPGESYVDPLFAFGPRAQLVLPISGRFAFRAFADLRVLALATRVHIYDHTDTEAAVWDPSYVNGLFGVGFSY